MRRGSFRLREHVWIHCVGSEESTEKDLGYWIHTHGMFLFDKPEIEVFSVPEEYIEVVGDVVNEVATYMARGADIEHEGTAESDNHEFWMKFRLNDDYLSLHHYGNKCLELETLKRNGKDMFHPLSRVLSISGFKHHLPPDILEQTRELATSGQAPPSSKSHSAKIRIFLQTPFDRLQLITNDYAEQERMFQHGLVQLVDLVDSDELAAMKAEEREKFQKEKRSVYRGFLENEQNVKSLSIVLPVRGRRAVLLETLQSLLGQSFVKYRAGKVEIIIIQDGYSEDTKDDPICQEVFEKLREFPEGVMYKLYKLRENRGRSTARNVGVYHATSEIVFFVDSSMILDRNFLTDQMLRHQRCTDIVLLGFKQNITWDEYQAKREDILQGRVTPDYRHDIKWAHVLTDDEGPFEFKEQHYEAGYPIYYMNLTTNFRSLTGTDAIGYRTLPTFFQTNIASVSANSVREVGGFEGRFDALWGFEDSFLGALLIAKGNKLVPCPSSLAFKIEHSEDVTKVFDIERHRQQFNELLKKRAISEYSSELLVNKISKLQKQNILDDVKAVSRSRARSIY